MEALGINIVSIMIYILLFAVVYFIINKFLLKSIVSTLEQRQKDIKEGLELKNSMEVRMEELTKEKEKIMAEARNEAKKVVNEALEAAKSERKDIFAEAKQEAEQIVEKANQKFDVERERLESGLEARVEKATRKAVADVYERNKLEIDKDLINKAIKQL